MAIFLKNLGYSYQYFNSIDDYQKSVDNWKNENFFSEKENKRPCDDEIQRTKEIIKRFDNKKAVELTKLYFKSDVIFWANSFEIFSKISFEKYGINPLYCKSLPGDTWQCGMISTDIKLQTLQDYDSLLTL